AVIVSSFSGIRKNQANLQENHKFYNIEKTELHRLLEELNSQSQPANDFEDDDNQCSIEITSLTEKKSAILSKLDEIKGICKKSKEELDKCSVNLSKKAALKKKNKKIERDNFLLQYLKQNYPGVLGRFG